MLFLGKIHRTHRIKVSHSFWCSFNSRFFYSKSGNNEKTLFFSEKIFPETFLGKSGTEWWQTCPKQFPQNPKFVPSMPGNILQKKSFLIQKFSPKTFLWTRRIEFLETRQLFFSRKCKLFRSKSENYYKKTSFSETFESFCFSSQSTSGNIGCFFDGPAEQSRTKFWTIFAQCLKRFMKVGNFVKQKFFLRKNIRTRIVKF